MRTLENRLPSTTHDNHCSDSRRITLHVRLTLSRFCWPRVVALDIFPWIHFLVRVVGLEVVYELEEVHDRNLAWYNYIRGYFDMLHGAARGGARKAKVLALGEAIVSSLVKCHVGIPRSFRLPGQSL
jgi:hypothetical protein